MNIPIIAYGGEKEESLEESTLEKYRKIQRLFLKQRKYFHYFRWKELTTIKELFRVRMFPGHHNFPSECSSQVLTSLQEDLNNLR